MEGFTKEQLRWIEFYTDVIAAEERCTASRENIHLTSEALQRYKEEFKEAFRLYQSNVPEEVRKSLLENELLEEMFLDVLEKKDN